MERFKKIVFGILFASFFLPFLQKQFSPFELEPLKGVILPHEKYDFTWESWFSGDFQKKYEDAIDDSIGLKSFFVRTHNQIEFSFYDKTTVMDLAIGKGNFLHSPSQIDGHLGRDFKGAVALDSVIHMIKFLQDTLKKKNIELVLVMAPGKPTFYEENYPTWIDTTHRSISNYGYYVQKFKEKNIRYIDFNKYFLDIKKTAKYPLYPKCGIHWSNYGAVLCADSLIKNIEKSTQTEIPDLSYRAIEVSEELRDTDNDCGDLMNLLWEIQSGPMAYPHVIYENNSLKNKPNVIVVADSYFWNINNMGVPTNLFDNYYYWYYNSTAYSKNSPPISVFKLNYKEEIEKSNVIIVMATENSCSRFGFGFFQKAYSLYKN